MTATDTRALAGNGATNSLLPAVSRRVGRARPETLRLWSIQPIAVWEHLERHGQLYVSPDQVPDDADLLDHRPAFDWMREQMAQRLPHYRGYYPWWAYFRPKPDLRRIAWEITPSGTRCVRLELAIEPERLLLSNIEAWWGGVCLDWYVGTDAADIEAWEAGWEHAGLAPLERPIPEPWHSLKVASWERVFDVDTLARSGRWEDKVQATFERLDLADVVAVTEFAARARPGPE